VPEDYRHVGQPVVMPGDMGTASWLLAGTATAMKQSFGSASHGAGRRLSRGAARRAMTGAEVREELEKRGIVVKSQSGSLLAEEGPHAYKDIADVVAVVDDLGLARKVARMRPLGVLKG
jgi:tRNA-splicing ligase RtcB (3'-phosphate/5'-hydroxy nucleic acid ligase)